MVWVAVPELHAVVVAVYALLVVMIGFVSAVEIDTEFAM